MRKKVFLVLVILLFSFGIVFGTTYKFEHEHTFVSYDIVFKTNERTSSEDKELTYFPGVKYDTGDICGGWWTWVCPETIDDLVLNNKFYQVHGNVFNSLDLSSFEELIEISYYPIKTKVFSHISVESNIDDHTVYEQETYKKIWLGPSYEEEIKYTENKEEEISLKPIYDKIVIEILSPNGEIFHKFKEIEYKEISITASYKTIGTSYGTIETAVYDLNRRFIEKDNVNEKFFKSENEDKIKEFFVNPATKTPHTFSFPFSEINEFRNYSTYKNIINDDFQKKRAEVNRETDSTKDTYCRLYGNYKYRIYFYKKEKYNEHYVKLLGGRGWEDMLPNMNNFNSPTDDSWQTLYDCDKSSVLDLIKKDKVSKSYGDSLKDNFMIYCNTGKRVRNFFSNPDKTIGGEDSTQSCVIKEIGEEDNVNYINDEDLESFSETEVDNGNLITYNNNYEITGKELVVVDSEKSINLSKSRVLAIKHTTNEETTTSPPNPTNFLTLGYEVSGKSKGLNGVFTDNTNGGIDMILTIERFNLTSDNYEPDTSFCDSINLKEKLKAFPLTINQSFTNWNDGSLYETNHILCQGNKVEIIAHNFILSKLHIGPDYANNIFDSILHLVS